MKKLFLLLLLSPMFAIAQPVLNAFSPIYGDSVSVRMFTYKINVSYPKTGNQNWDFSSFAQVPESFVVKLINPASAPHIATFPTANITQSISSGGNVMAYMYGRITADSLWTMATRFPGMPSMDEDYINPSVSFRYPMSINNTITDQSETSQNPGVIETIEKKYVAWGTIKTPHGTYNNVVLMEEYELVGANMELKKYQWFDVAGNYMVADIDVSDSTGTWYVVNTNPSNTSELNEVKYQVSLYPNPSNNSSNISLNLPSTTDINIDIIALQGQKSFSINKKALNAGTHNIEIPAESLQNGHYYVRIKIGNDVVVKPLLSIK